MQSYNEKIDEPIRRGFVRKVYSIVGLQILVTSLIASILSLNLTLSIWAARSSLLASLSVGSVGLLMLLSFMPDLRYRHPWNLVLLALFTICIAGGVGQACAIITLIHNSMIVLQALLTTAFGVAGLVAFALQTRYRLSTYNGALAIALSSLVGLSLLTMLFPGVFSFLDFFISLASSVVFAGYIMIDTQTITRGALNSDDYVSAALNIYLDIVNLFMSILKILSESQRRKPSRKDED